MKTNIENKKQKMKDKKHKGKQRNNKRKCAISSGRKPFFIIPSKYDLLTLAEVMLLAITLR